MSDSATACQALLLIPEYRDYVWGGSRLRPDHVPTAEAWVIYEGDHISSGALAGRTLAEAAAAQSQALLGWRAVQRTGTRFPLLIKLVDCAQWLSLQVHPNDEQAMHLEGPGQFGKTEAWHFIESGPGAETLCGLRPGMTRANLEQAVRRGTILDEMQHLMVHTGDTILLKPGMIHALGPGLLVYEVQQTSDITYRIFDWNRPLTQGRKLHIEQALAVADINAAAQIIPQLPFADGDQRELVACSYFTLQLLAGQTNSISLDTGGESFHALTVIEGGVQVKGPGWQLELDCLESLVVPAACGFYQIRPRGPFRALKASV